MSPWLALVLGLVVVVVITGATAFFVAQEFAYLAVDRSRLAAGAAGGDDAAARALAITRRLSFMLSGAQLGITVTGLLVGYVAEPLIGVSLATLVGGSSTGWALAVASVVAIGFSTLVQMVLGELVPKNYSIARAEPVARALSRPTRLYLAVFGPLVWVFDKAAEIFLRMLRIEPVHDVEHAATPRDLARVVAESRASGDLPAELSTMIDRILDFPGRDVEHAMVPRSRVDVVRDSATVGEVRHLMATGNSRYPVLDDTDAVVGVVHLLDVLREGEHADEPVLRVVRPPLVLAELMALPDALRVMRAAKEMLACVVDEYGGFTGILTLEDLAEEVVGEITDEHDPDDAAYEPVEGDGVWVVSGGVHVDEVERAAGVELPRGDFETVSGLVIDAQGGLPAVGDVVRVELPDDPGDLVHEDTPVARVLRAEVLAVENHVPARLRLTLEEEGR